MRVREGGVHNVGTARQLCLASGSPTPHALGFPDGSGVKNLPATQETQVQYPEYSISNGKGNGNPLQCSCLGNPMDRGAWPAIVHGVAKSWT